MIPRPAQNNPQHGADRQTWSHQAARRACPQSAERNQQPQQQQGRCESEAEVVVKTCLCQSSSIAQQLRKPDRQQTDRRKDQGAP